MRQTNFFFSKLPFPCRIKTLHKSFLEPKGQWPWVLVCNIGDVGPIKFV